MNATSEPQTYRCDQTSGSVQHQTHLIDEQWHLAMGYRRLTAYDATNHAGGDCVGIRLAGSVVTMVVADGVSHSCRPELASGALVSLLLPLLSGEPPGWSGAQLGEVLDHYAAECHQRLVQLGPPRLPDGSSTSLRAKMLHRQYDRLVTTVGGAAALMAVRIDLDSQRCDLYALGDCRSVIATADRSLVWQADPLDANGLVSSWTTARGVCGRVKHCSVTLSPTRTFRALTIMSDGLRSGSAMPRNFLQRPWGGHQRPGEPHNVQAVQRIAGACAVADDVSFASIRRIAFPTRSAEP